VSRSAVSTLLPAAATDNTPIYQPSTRRGRTTGIVLVLVSPEIA
jgi:hypothetical protein